MTNKEFELKEYLSQAYYAGLKINTCLNELERIKAMMTRSASLVIIGKNDGMRRNRTEELFVKYAEYTRKLENIIDEQNQKLITVSDIINKVKDEKYNLLLFLRYIQHKRWEDIASTLQYDVRYTMKLHIKALRELIKLGVLDNKSGH